jgi:hypothetical protein
MILFEIPVVIEVSPNMFCGTTLWTPPPPHAHTEIELLKHPKIQNFIFSLQNNQFLLFFLKPSESPQKIEFSFK